jgi:hypothetical protein
MCEFETFTMIEVVRWLENSVASIPQLDLRAWSEYKGRLKSFRPGPNALPDRGMTVDLGAAARFKSNAARVLNECHSKDDVVREWQN